MVILHLSPFTEKKIILKWLVIDNVNKNNIKMEI